MPQAHNKDIARTVGVGKNTRFMSVSETGAGNKRRLMAKLKIEKRFREHNLAVMERNTNITTAHLDRIARELKASLLKTLAYKEVISQQTFSKVEDKKKRLDARYTQYAMRHEIQAQIKKLEPVYMREQKAKDQIEKQRGVLNKIIHRNLRAILSPRARERKRLLRELNLERQSTFESSIESPEPPKVITSRQNTKGLIVTKDQIKSKGKSSPMTVQIPALKLPSISDNNKTTGKQKKSFTTGVTQEKPAIKNTTRVRLPPIQVSTVR